MPLPSWQRRAPGLPVSGSAGAFLVLRKARSSSIPDASPPKRSPCSVRESCTTRLSYQQPAFMHGIMSGGSISFTGTASLSCIWQGVTGSMGRGPVWFLAIKTEDGAGKGKISFYCRMLKVTRQGFYKYLATKTIHGNISSWRMP